MEHDEIYLIDMWRIFIREWRWFVAVFVATLAITFAFTHLVTRQWEATAWVRIGQVGLVPSGQSPQVEPLQRIVERMQMVPFKNKVMRDLGFEPTSSEAGLYRKSLKLEPLPYSGPLVRFRVRATTPSQARKFATATVARLQATHRPLEATLLKAAHVRLEEVETDLRNVKAERKRLLQSVMPGAKGPAGRGSVANPMLANMMLSSKNDEIRRLQGAKIDIMDRLGPTYTFDTSMPWPVYVPHKQAFPNSALAWGIGLLLGIFLGALAAVTRNLARRPA